MEKIPVRKISGEVFVHESEDPAKVEKAFSVFFQKKLMKTEDSDGIFGTKIKIITASVEKKQAHQLAKTILDSLSSREKFQIINELKLRLDENGSLFLRFDKQKAYADEKLVLTSEEEDSIKIAIALEAFPANMPNFINSAKSLFQA